MYSWECLSLVRWGKLTEARCCCAKQHAEGLIQLPSSSPFGAMEGIKCYPTEEGGTGDATERAISTTVCSGWNLRGIFHAVGSRIAL